MLQTNLREIDATLDVEQVLDDIQDHGANAWLVNGGGILSFYPTDLDFQTRNPYLDGRPGGDLVGDALAGARARGTRLLARMDFSKVAPEIAARHPDWLFVDAEGRNQVFQSLYSVCPSAPYYQERLFDVLDEFISRYPVDGFFINWTTFNEIDYAYVYRGPCHCAACRSGWAEYSGGLDFPEDDQGPTYVTWRGFCATVIDDLTARIRAFIAARLPDAALILGQSADIMFHEANSKVGRGFWPAATSQAVSMSKSVRPDVPVLVNSAVFLDMPYRYAPIQDEHYAFYFIQAIARGAIPSTYTMGPPRDAPYANLPAGGAVTRFHRDHEDSYRYLRPAAEVLLVRGEDASTTSWWADASEMELRGTCEALQRAHIPFDICSIREVATAIGRADSAYRVVVLCDVGPLGSAAADLDAWVAAGGHLVALGASGIDGVRVECGSSPASRRVATHRDPQVLKNTYVAVSTPGVGDGYDRLAPLYGAFHFLDLRPDCEVFGDVLGQVPYGPPEKCHGTLPTGYAGRATRRTGEGTHTVLPWLPGTSYRHLGAPGAGTLLVDTVEAALDSPLLTAHLPGQVELIVGRTPRGFLVHLINLTGVQANSVGPFVPIAGGRLRVRVDGPVTAEALTRDLTLSVTNDADGYAEIALPELQLFEAIEVRSGA